MDEFGEFQMSIYNCIKDNDGSLLSSDISMYDYDIKNLNQRIKDIEQSKHNLELKKLENLKIKEIYGDLKTIHNSISPREFISGRRKITPNNLLIEKHQDYYTSSDKIEFHIIYFLDDKDNNIRIYLKDSLIFAEYDKRRKFKSFFIKDYSSCLFSGLKDLQIKKCEECLTKEIMRKSVTIDKISYNYNKFSTLVNFK